MTFSAIKHITYAAGGGLAAGSVAGWAIASTVTARAAGAAYPYFRCAGLALAITSAVARTVD